MSEQTAMVASPADRLFIAPVASLIQFKERYALFHQFVHSIMREGLDYGTIPGTGTKPTLLKPGAEKLLTLFGFTSETFIDDLQEDWTGKDHGGEAFFYYRYTTRITYRGSNELIASAQGSCNSWETKYRYRMAEPTCPVCGKATIKKSKFPPRNQPNAILGWYCHSKMGGCGQEFVHDDKRITEQPRGQVPNPNPADLVNTLMKMAQKRAMVAAVLVAANASDYFTQDIEDMSSDAPEFVESSFAETTETTSTTTSPEPTTQATSQPPAKVQKIKTPQIDSLPGSTPMGFTPAALTEYRKLAYQLKVKAKDAEFILASCNNDIALATSAMKKSYGPQDQSFQGDEIEAGIDPSDGLPFGDK